MHIDGMEIEQLSDHPHYHRGRPTFGRFGVGKTARIWMLCPQGHFILGVAIREWAGSRAEAALNDSTYMVECIGTPSKD